MILSISSSLKTFKRITFHKGLNVLLSDRHPLASEGQTRNSAGKTSLIEILHFLLGADCEKASIFRSEALIEHSFMGDFVFWGLPVSVERSGSQPARIYIDRGLEGRDDLPIKMDRENDKRFISNENWKVFLGHILFGLPAEPTGTKYDEPYTPSFRTMISYFIRRDNSGAFITPERQAEKQQRWDYQENLSYLLGLDWQIPFEFQRLKLRETALEELKKAAKGGVLGDLIGTVAELRSKVTVAERNSLQKREQLQDLQVLESYNELATKAARAKTDMQAISRKTVGLRETLNHLETAFRTEAPPDPAALEEVYAAAGIELPGIALRRLEEVQSFYQSVVRNRAVHLKREIEEVASAISANESRIANLDRGRREILQTLETHGALEDFLMLQRQLADLEAEAASLRERFKAAEILEGEKTQLDIDRSNLHRRLQQDFQERKKRLDSVILFVSDTIAKLYDDRSGNFVISATDHGPEFKISIEGDRGGGIASMEIFCFDLALFQICSMERRGPGFLVHDSHLFDGVDERQIAKALRLGREATKLDNRQYIVTMNSDIFDRLPLPESMSRNQIVLPTRLSDETDSGGLFGVRF